MKEVIETIKKIHDDLNLISRVSVWESHHVWMTAEEMCDLLSSRGERIAPKTLKEKAASGDVRGHKFPGSNKWFFNPREVSEDIRTGGPKKVEVRVFADRLIKKHRAKHSA